MNSPIITAAIHSPTSCRAEGSADYSLVRFFGSSPHGASVAVFVDPARAAAIEFAFAHPSAVLALAKAQAEAAE